MCKVCVAIFVLLSAYGLYRSYESYCELKGESLKNAVSFTWKHLKKLITGYWWAVVPFAVLGMATGMRSFATVYGTGGKSLVYLIVDILGLGGRVDMNHMFNVTCWYIALAVGLYLLFPIFYHLIRKNTILFCGVTLVLCFRPFGDIILTSKIWILPFALGLVFAKYNLFEKVMNQTPKVATQIGIVLLLIGLALLRRRYGVNVDGFFAIGIICFMLFVTSKLPIVATIFDFIGKHSANIFMTHTFFFSYYWSRYIYSPKYPILIFALLLSVCLVYSILLEKIKVIVKSCINKRKQQNLIST